MKVTAIKPAFINGSLIRLGEQVEIPDGTKGSWFAPPESAEAQVATKIKVSHFVPIGVSERLALGKPLDLTDRGNAEPLTLSEGAWVRNPSFLDVMRASSRAKD